MTFKLSGAHGHVGGTKSSPLKPPFFEGYLFTTHHVLNSYFHFFGAPNVVMYNHDPKDISVFGCKEAEAFTSDG